VSTRKEKPNLLKYVLSFVTSVESLPPEMSWN